MHASRANRDLPHLTPPQERLARTLAVLSLLFGLYWIYWRWTATLNPDALIFSIALVSAESWGLFASMLFVFQAWQLSARSPPACPPGRTVDVFITTYDEPLEVLRRTAIAARAIRYPHRTYILDDGKRADVQALAAELGIGYIRRPGNQCAKAGNLNHALGVTTGEFILQLDADHVPLPTIVDRMLGYFEDARVAFVQSPQDFYNTDSFTHVVNDEGRRLWEENRIFYSLLQPGKDTWNASFFCGSCGILRRSALEGIGGFSTHTIIEDMETSLVLHSRGWKSVYHGEALAFGLSPASAGQFHVQRLRWGQGSMQILRKLNPLFLPGLTLPQRLCYFAANVYVVDGLQKTIFYLTPIAFLITGYAPVRADGGEILIRLLPYLFLSISAFELLARGTGNLLLSERYVMAKFFTYVLSLTGYFARGRLKFNVTPKGLGDVPFKTYAPQLTLLVLSVVAVVWAPLAYSHGWITYQIDRYDAAFWLGGVWIVWNIYFSGSVVHQSLRMQQQRAHYRFAENLPVALRVLCDDGPAQAQLALTYDLSPHGLAFRSSTRLELGTRLELELPLTPRPIRAAGEVMHVAPIDTQGCGVYLHGVRFQELPIAERDAIELHCTQHAVPIWRRRYRQSLHVFERAGEVMRNARTVRRRLIQLPAHLHVAGSEHSQPEARIGLLEDLSARGARLLLEEPIAPGTAVSFKVPGTALTGAGEVVFSEALESPMSVRFAVGLKLVLRPAAPPRRFRWSTLGWRRSPRAHERVPVPAPAPAATPDASNVLGSS